MVSVRSAKSKGSQFEYSVYDSLEPFIEDIRLTKELGFVAQYDLVSDKSKLAIECKRHKGFSWNQMVKLFQKLEEKMPERYDGLLIFQGNRQPPLCMFRNMNNHFTVQTFEDYFGIEFVKHVGYKK